jgi:endoglucanase
MNATSFWSLAGVAALLFGCDAGDASPPPDYADGGGTGGSAGSSGAGGSGGSSGAAGSPGGGTGGSGGSTPVPTAPGGYYTQGNQILRQDGTAHLFHGVSRPSLEWIESGEELKASDYELIASWGANVVRLPLNQAFWLRYTAYPGNVDQQIQWAKAAGLDVIVDLHWSDRGVNGQAAQQRMADANSKIFWQQVATKYKDDGRVQFELYNEPYDVGWAVWKNGGPSGDGFTVVGMQELYDTVRATGAHNLVIIGGLDHAYDLSGVKNARIQGYNIAYATHPYDYAGKQPSDWQADWGYLTATDPVIITEFGVTTGNCGTAYYDALIGYANQNRVSWVAWAWYPKDCAFPSLITDWGGNPSAAGSVVRNALQAL